MKIFNIILLSLICNIGCGVFAPDYNHSKPSLMYAQEARALSINAKLNQQSEFLNKLLTEIIPNMAKQGKTRVWLLSSEFPIELDLKDAIILKKYGYDVEMCIDADRIAYVNWN